MCSTHDSDITGIIDMIQISIADIDHNDIRIVSEWVCSCMHSLYSSALCTSHNVLAVNFSGVELCTF